MQRRPVVPVVLLAVLLAACQGVGEARRSSGETEAPVRITSAPGQELYPSLAWDGTALVLDMATTTGLIRVARTHHYASMRTTLTLDPDVVRLLKEEERKRADPSRKS
jgi:hypothetical protein